MSHYTRQVHFDTKQRISAHEHRSPSKVLCSAPSDVYRLSHGGLLGSERVRKGKLKGYVEGRGAGDLCTKKLAFPATYSVPEGRSQLLTLTRAFLEASARYLRGYQW